MKMLANEVIRRNISLLRQTQRSTSGREDHKFSRRWLLGFAIGAAEEVLRLRKVLKVKA